MGGSVSKALARIFGNKEMRILMLGLDAAGKTSILFITSTKTLLKFFFSLCSMNSLSIL
jgi:hypothetical protein